MLLLRRLCGLPQRQGTSHVDPLLIDTSKLPFATRAFTDALAQVLNGCVLLQPAYDLRPAELLLHSSNFQDKNKSTLYLSVTLSAILDQFSRSRPNHSRAACDHTSCNHLRASWAIHLAAALPIMNLEGLEPTSESRDNQ